MRILIDADTTPRSARNICEEIGRQFDIPVKSVSEMDRDFSSDSPSLEELANHDYRITSMTTSSDIVVTMDYTLASQIFETALAVIHPKGFVYSAANMDELLYQRYMEKKKHSNSNNSRAEEEGINTGKLMHRTRDEDQAFTALLLDLVAPISREI